MRKKNDAEIVFTRLQADRSGVMNVLRKKRFTELLEAPPRKCRERLVHIAQISKRRQPSTAIRQFADVFSRPGGIELRGKLRREAPLYGRQHRTPALPHANDCPAGTK